MEPDDLEEDEETDVCVCCGALCPRADGLCPSCEEAVVEGIVEGLRESAVGGGTN